MDKIIEKTPCGSQGPSEARCGKAPFIIVGKHKRANPGGGWPFCRNHDFLFLGKTKARSSQYACSDAIWQVDFVDAYHLQSRYGEITTWANWRVGGPAARRAAGDPVVPRGLAGGS